MNWFSIATLAAIWIVAKLATDGHKIILFGPTSGTFKFGARIDVTFIAHVTGYFLLCFIHPLFALLAGITQEFVDGFMSPQGCDFIDLLSDAWGIAWWYSVGMDSIIRVF